MVKGVFKMIKNWEIVIRLILSAIIGGMIGVEREVNNRPAGLRTHILVSVGSALIMLVSIDGFNNVGDPARLASQVVTGVGFLGAGTIIKTGNNIKGLTTAASLWVCSGIGLAIGNGYYLGGITTAGIVLLTLISLTKLERKIIKKNSETLEVTGKNRPGLIGEIGTFLGKNNISIRDVQVIDNESSINNKDSEVMEVHFLINSHSHFNLKYMYSKIYEIQGVLNVIYEGTELSPDYCEHSLSTN